MNNATLIKEIAEHKLEEIGKEESELENDLITSIRRYRIKFGQNKLKQILDKQDLMF